jgi:hypothetical protein
MRTLECNNWGESLTDHGAQVRDEAYAATDN